ncbi:MAG: neutral/alkaline non-lysosomal ceramidase N-terminal domain-containing protein [Verrucomicrobia bacterium]|nr:neutral/alkaline non-lysosomal ceramidase N-terminal domain-containing protein [Verrucomicrobiota bacterium]
MSTLFRFVVFSLCATVASWAAAPAGLRAGAFAQDITPTQLPSPINGGMKGAFAKAVTDPMHARAFAVQSGATTLVFCVVDCCMIPREICESAKAIATKATGLPTSHLLISATHSHSCATMTPVFQSDADPVYVQALPARIAEAIIRAHANLEPAEVAYGGEADPTQVFNRRWHVKDGESYENPFDSKGDRAWMNPGYQNPKVTAPAGPTDPEVAILAARAKSDGRPIAVLANYSLHYVGGLAAISADYYGVFARELATRLRAGDARYAGKPAFVGILSNGTSGNINNVNYAALAPPRRAPGEQIATVAKSVGDAAMRAWDGLQWQSSLPLAVAERDIALAVRRPNAADLERARKIVATTKRDADGQFSDRKAIYALESIALEAYPETVPVKLQAHRIGRLTVAAIPCEVFVEIGLDLKATKPLDRHFTISLANGYNGYLPTPEHHRLGGYETWRARSSYLEVEASTKITAELKKLLATVAK